MTSDFERQVDDVVRGLLRKDRRGELESYRFHGSSNRVYWIPIGERDDEFVIVKLLPGWMNELRMAVKIPLRNLLYGEHDAWLSRRRVQWEVERYREWAAAGIPVPPLVESSLSGIRIIKGVPLPTLYTVLTDASYPAATKLRSVRWAARSLFRQHQVALEMQRKSLFHREPGPWNILVDAEGGDTYWYDLEHPSQYQGMSAEDLMVRGLRIFAIGVLTYLPSQVDEALAVTVDEYRFPAVVSRLASDLRVGLQARPQRLARAIGLRKSQFARQELLAHKLAELSKEWTKG